MPIAGDLERAQYEVLEVAIQIFDCDLSVLFPMNPLTGDFGWPPRVSGKLLEGQSAFDRPRPDGLARHTLAAGGVLKVEDLREKPEYASRFTQQEKVHSFIAIEIDLPKRPRPLAVVYIDFREPHTFGDKEEQLIRQFVGRARAILRRAWRYEKVLDLGHEINQQLDDPGALFRLLDDRIRDIIDAGNRFCLGVLDPITDSVTKYVSRARGVIQEECAPLTDIDREAIFAGSVMRMPIRDGQPADEIFVPMVFRNVPLGFVSIEQAQADPFDNEDLRVIELLRNQVATALHGLRLFADLDTISQVAKQLHEEVTSFEAFHAFAENVRQGSGADLVILYRWVQDEGFILPPFVAGDLLDPDFLQPSRPDPMLMRVVNYDGGIFCENASTLLTELGLKGGGGTFRKREKIASAAAISLRVGPTVGVLFINYRKPQQFGGPRKRLIRILAAFAATALQSSHRFLEREGQFDQGMEIVRRVDAELNRTTRLADVLHTILGLANGYVQAEEASLLLADARGEEFTLLVAIGEESKELVGWKGPITGSKGIVRWVFENRQAVLVRDLKNEERWKNLFIGGKKTRSELDVPLLDGDRVIGVLNFESHRKNAFTVRQQDFIRNIAGQFVLAVKRAQDYEARAAELKLFWDFTRDTVGHLDTTQLLDVTLTKTVGTVGATAGALLWYDNATGTYVATTTHGYGAGPAPATRYHIGEGLIGTTSQQLFHGDPSGLVIESERWLVRDSPSVIVAPIRREPKLWGAILLTSDSPTGFNESTVRLTEAISGMIAIALENAEEYEKSEKDREALHDLSAQVLQVSGNPTAVVHSVVTHALKLTNSTRSDLDLYANNKLMKTYFCDMVDGHPSAVHEKSLDPMPKGVVRSIMAHVAKTRQAYYTKGDAQDDPLYAGIEGIHCELAVPLLTRSGELLGVLNVESRYVNAFDERSKHLLELFGDAAVTAFEIARSREIVNVAVRLAEMTHENYGEACELTAETAATHCGCLAVVRLYDRQHDDLVLKHRAGAGEDPFTRVNAKDGLTGQAMQTADLQCIDDLLDKPPGTPAIVLSDPKTRSLLIAPVIVQGVPYGSVGLSHPQPNHFGDLDKNFVLGLAHLLGSTLQRFESLRREMKQKRTVILSATAQDALDLHHDFGGLNYVSSWITLAEQALAQNDFEKARKEYAEVNVEVSKAIELIRTVRDRMASVPEPVNKSVQSLIEKVIKDAQVPESVDIVIDIPKPSPIIYADLYDMSKILNHLVSNAVEAMPDGGTLSFSVRDNPPSVDIDVIDTGCGIDEAYIRDFETASHPKPGHTGWGLRSALRRAEFNDGTLFVAQTSERGTTFTLRLPRAGPDDWEVSVENEPTPSNRVV